jgi:hypothetical protein
LLAVAGCYVYAERCMGTPTVELYPKPVDRGLGEERGVPSWLSKTSGG